MSEELSEEEILALEQTYTYIDQSLWEGKSEDEVVKELVKLNYSKDIAMEMINNRKETLYEEYKRTPEGRKMVASVHKRRMISGILWFAGGLTITLVTYALAEGGGWYFIFFGAIIFGFIDFVRGLIGWLHNQ